MYSEGLGGNTCFGISQASAGEQITNASDLDLVNSLDLSPLS